MNAVTAQEVPAILLNLLRVPIGMRADPFCVPFGFRVYRRQTGRWVIKQIFVLLQQLETNEQKVECGIAKSERCPRVNHGSSVLIERLHICRQNLSTVRVAEQLSDGKA